MNLIIETTRRCNMSCDHCLRGAAQKLDMPPEYITALAKSIAYEYLDSVTFSGGEPSLAADVILDTLAQLKHHNVKLGSFYIATNGSAISEDFVIACLKLYSYSDDKNMCQVQVSNDYYHAEEDNYDTELLDGLSFFSRKHSIEATYEFNCINEGNYAENYNDTQNLPSSTEITDTDSFNRADIYLNCLGQVVNGCDWSYESQPANVICHVTNLATYLSTLPKGED